jgi:hypothetical protein
MESSDYSPPQTTTASNTISIPNLSISFHSPLTFFLSLLSFRVIFISGFFSYAFELMAEELARHNKMSSTIRQQLLRTL